VIERGDRVEACKIRGELLGNLANRYLAVVHGEEPLARLDAEFHFSDGPFAGLKLIGFAIWERRGGGGRNVTFPARQYAVNSERRSFALLRPIVDTTAQHRIRELALEAYRVRRASRSEALNGAVFGLLSHPSP